MMESTRHLERECPLCGVTTRELMRKVAELTADTNSQSKLIRHLYQQIDDLIRRQTKKEGRML